jgi:hypothetical protein
MEASRAADDDGLILGDSLLLIPIANVQHVNQQERGANEGQNLCSNQSDVWDTDVIKMSP